jgi:hypothetical protein
MRILDARSVFSPFVDLRKTIEILRAYGVDAVVLNGRFDRAPATDYWSMTSELYDSALAKFRARPDLFRPVFDASRARVFELTDAARQGPLPDSATAGGPRQFGGADAPRLVVSTGPVRQGALALCASRLSKSQLAPGDTLELFTAWSLADSVRATPGSYAVYVRLDARAMPRGPLYSEAWDKPYRKVLEKVSGQRWRLRSAHRLLDGMCGPDEWRFGDLAIDRTWFVIPGNLALGTYDVGVALVRTPHYPNTRIADYLHDKDLFSGRVVASARIAPPAPRAQAAR